STAARRFWASTASASSATAVPATGPSRTPWPSPPSTPPPSSMSASWRSWRRTRPSAPSPDFPFHPPAAARRAQIRFEGPSMTQAAFLFPGQGAQTVGMGRQLADTLPAARRLFDEAAKILGYDLLEVCEKGPAERLNATDVSQPALFVCSLAA